LEGAYSGISHLLITSDEWHKQNDTMLNKMFGMEWNEVKAFVIAMFDLEQKDLIPADLANPLSMFEQCLMLLIAQENDINQEILGKYFSRKQSAVSHILKKWSPLWGEVGLHLGTLPFVDADLIDALEPLKNQQLGLEKHGATVDRKDWFSEMAQSDQVASITQQSGKLDHAGFHVMTWSLGCGLVFEHMCPFLARAGEKALIEIWGKYGRLKNIPIGYLILGDKGFEGTSGSYPNYNTVLHPAFLHGHEQFSTEQICHNLKVCQLRYTCETVYSRVTNRHSLCGMIRRAKFEYFEDSCNWAHGRANLYMPLQMPAKYVNYFSD
jgi:hypothetical protein